MANSVKQAAPARTGRRLPRDADCTAAQPPHTSQNTAKIRGTYGRSGPGYEIAAAGMFHEATAFSSLASYFAATLIP